MGSVEKDLFYRKEIQKKVRLHSLSHRDKEKSENLQRKRLLWFLNKIVANSPFYKSPPYKSILSSRHLEDNFVRIPLLEKIRLKEMAEDFISGKKENAYFKVWTSGSSGEPLKMWFDQDFFVGYYAYFLSFLRRMELKPLPHSTCILTLSAFRTPMNNPYEIIQPLLNYSSCIYTTIHPSLWRSPSEAVNFISLRSPMILYAMPSTLELLCETIDNTLPPIPIRPRLIISVMETLLPETRRKIEKFFGVPVLDEYGLSEMGGIVAAECRQKKGFHINTVDYYVEIVNSSGEILPDGEEGEIVITNLYNRTVPLLRYRTGDFGVMIHKQCSCGSVAPRIAKLTGRSITRFVLPDGSTYNPFDKFGIFLVRLPLKKYQLIQQKDFHITLFYIGDSGISDHNDARAMRRKVHKLYKGRATFQIKKVDKFDFEGKFQPFLNLS
jgi:phenylacetate-coenzyme A ligase PaaK-like adenylate-forming protein